MAVLESVGKGPANGGLIHHNAQEETWTVALNSSQIAQDNEISTLEEQQKKCYPFKN